MTTPGLDIALVGLSHRTASVAVRERCAVERVDFARRLRALTALEAVQEAFIVSTCNRTEVLIAGPLDEAVHEAVRDILFRDAPDDTLYSYRGIAAVTRKRWITAGLDSLVLGETQILAQVKQAIDASRAAGSVGTQLTPLLQQSLTVGKRVRSETKVGEGSLSVARVGVEIAARVFGEFSDCRALIAGAGETARLVAKHLSDRGVNSFAFCNRTLANAEAAAAEFGGSGHGLDELGSLIESCDMIIPCVEGSGEILRPEHLPSRVLRKRDRPLVILDLSVPRAVAPAVAELNGVFLYDLDHLAEVVRENRRERERALQGTSEILVAEVHKFLSLRTYAAFSPAISELRERFEQVRENVLDSVADGPPGARELALAHDLTRRLLDVALGQMKAGARHAQREDELSRAYRRFLDDL